MILETRHDGAMTCGVVCCDMTGPVCGSAAACAALPDGLPAEEEGAVLRLLPVLLQAHVEDVSIAPILLLA